MDATEIFTALLAPEGRSDPYPLYASLHELGAAVAVPPSCARAAPARLSAVSAMAETTAIQRTSFRESKFATFRTAQFIEPPSE